MVWSHLGWGRLTGKIRRNQPIAEGRIKSGGAVGSPPADDEFLYCVVNVLERIGNEIGKTISQVAINWLLKQQTVSNIIIIIIILIILRNASSKKFFFTLKL